MRTRPATHSEGYRKRARASGAVMMVDTPRWSRELAERYAASGSVTDVLLTHRDHAAHGRRYADHFGARLWIHEEDLDAAPSADCVIRGFEPVEIGEGVTAFPLPGHTRGSVLYLADARYCFSGDSFYWSRSTGDLEVAESVTWYSIEELAPLWPERQHRCASNGSFPGTGVGAGWPLTRCRGGCGVSRSARKLRPRPVDFTAVRW